MRQKITFRRRAFQHVVQFTQTGIGRMVRRICITHPAQDVTIPRDMIHRKFIQRMAVCCRIQQRVIFKLAVNFHQHIANLFQCLDRYGAIVNPRAAFPVGAQRAAQNQHIIGINAVFIQNRTQCIIAIVKFGNNGRPVASMTDQPRIRPRPQRQRQRIHQDTFARAGFAG